MAQSDPWAVVEQGSPQEKEAAASVSWPQPAGSASEPDQLYVVVAVLYFLASATHFVWLAIARSNSLVDPHAYAFPQQDANKGYVLLLFAAVGTLVLIRRTRVFGLGLAIALPVSWIAINPGNFRPSLFTRPSDGRTAMIVFISIELATVIAAGFAGFALRDLLRREPPAVIPERAQRLRIGLLCLGGGALLGGGLLLLSNLMSWRVDHYGLPGFGDLHTYYCCNFTGRSNFGKAGALGGFAVVAGFAIAAGFIRSRALSVAWLLGPALFNAGGLPDIGIRAIFPRQSLLGWNAASRFSDYVASTTLLPGFWFALGGTLVIVAAACVRLRIGRQSAGPYPQIPANAYSLQGADAADEQVGRDV